PVERPKAVGLEPGQYVPRLLVVDDMLDNRRLLSRLLSTMGFEVREAANGEEAIATWRDWRPDLIWMDIRIPVLDGRSALRRIRLAEEEERARSDGDGAGHPVGPCKIVALTASAFDHERDGVLESGADDLVTKPFREEWIAEALERHLGVRLLYEAPNAAET